MFDPNEAMDQFLERARAEGGSARKVLERWYSQCRQLLRSPQGVIGQEAARTATARAFRRLNRAENALRDGYRVCHWRKGARYGLDWARRARPKGRGTPLHQRGVPAGSYVPADSIRRYASNDGCPTYALTALCHFQALRGMTATEAEAFLCSLAKNYHRNVRSLHQIKTANPACYGQPREGRITTVDSKGNILGEHVARFPGVWLREISYAKRLEDRVMTVVFAHARGKRSFEATVPLMADPSTVCMVPTDQPTSGPEPADAAKRLAELAGVVGSPVEEVEAYLCNRASGWWIEQFGKSCEWNWRFGRMRARGWSSRRGNWIYENGIWIESVDMTNQTFTVALERSMGRVKRVTLTIGSLLGDLLDFPFAKMERDCGDIFRLLDDESQVCGYAIFSKSPVGARWFVGRTLTQAAVRKRDFLVDSERGAQRMEEAA